FTNVIASDKYVYLPLVGLLLPIASFLAVWLRNPGRDDARASRSRAERKTGLERSEIAGGASHSPDSVKTRRVIALAGAIVLATAYTVLGRNYIERWRDTETLYRYMLTLWPGAN